MQQFVRFLYRWVNSHKKTVFAFIVVCGLFIQLRTSRYLYARKDYNDISRHFYKIQNLDISGDFYCNGSVTNNSCTFYSNTGTAMELCLNLGDKCKGFTYNIGPRKCTLKSQVRGKPMFTLGIVTYFKNEFKPLLNLTEQNDCLLTEKNENKHSNAGKKVCNLPKIDPFDPTIMKMIEKVPPLVCKGEKNLTFYHNGKLMLTPGSNVTKAEYHVIRGIKSSGSGYEIFKSGILTSSNSEVILNEDMVYVDITKEDSTKQVEYHLDVQARKSILRRNTNIKPGVPLNVIMIGLDSTSHAHFQRKLRTVYKYMKEELQSIMFNGYSTIGDGTTIALIGMLVGRHFEELEPEGRKGKLWSTCIDEWPWIFYDMKKHGYVTYYNEDEMYNGAITTRLKGFCQPPPDHYLLPFWYAALERYQKDNDKTGYIGGHCLGSQAIYNISFNAVKSLFTAYPKMPKFGFLMNSDFCHHEDFNYLSIVEDDLLRFLKDLKYNNYLNNTLLVLFGDHGLRYGLVRTTILGRMEERLPFLSITLPHWVRKAYPEFITNLEKNKEVLTSPFDLHATLQHLLSYPNMPQGLPHGRSLFTDIGERTCDQAGVPFHYCSCLEWSEVDVNNEVIKNSALAVVDVINNKLNGLVKKCAKLYFKHVISAVIIGSKGGDDKENSDVDPSKDTTLRGGCIYQLQLSTIPNNAAYEATVQMIGGVPNVNPHIGRINEYGEQSDCIRTTHPLLREFCFCLKT